MENLPLLTVLEAPGGYGKTTYINKVCKKYESLPKIIYNFPENDSNTFFLNLKRLCKSENLKHPEHNTIFEWFNKLKEQEFIFIIDDFHLLNFSPEVIDFFSYFLKNPPEKIHFIFSGRSIIKLPFQNIINSGKGIYLDKNHLKISQEDFLNLIGKEYIAKYDYYSGWPQGIFLYADFINNRIDENTFKRLIDSAISDVFKNIFVHGKFNFSRLKEYFLDISSWPEAWKEKFHNRLQSSAEYWILQSNTENIDINEHAVLLERALKISLAEKNEPGILNICTRLIHSYTLTGEFDKVDYYLILAERNLNNSSLIDKTAFLYLKANRMRQLCNHEYAIKLLDEILIYESDNHKILTFQTKANVLKGLIEYQKGNYEKTRGYYCNALILSRAENNIPLKLEIEIMLAFLDEWEGKTSNLENEKIIAEIEKQTIKNQPMMWLNFCFYLLLGSKPDTEKAQEIIEKIKVITSKLKWDSFIPLIADIESRIWRYKNNFINAHRCHDIALQGIRPGTFEHIHATLNLAITFKREGKKEKSEVLLDGVIEKAKLFGTLGLEREALALYGKKIDENESISNENDFPDKSSFSIQTFGGFQAKNENQVIKKWQRKKSKNLLLHLLMKPKGIHRETLADLIFENENIENPIKNLDVSIHSLRKVLEPERKNKESSFILFSDSCYFFNWKYPNDIDFYKFEKNYKEWNILKNKLNTSYEILNPVRGGDGGGAPESPQHHELKSEVFYENRAFEIAKIITSDYKGEFLPEIDFADNWQEERENFKRQAFNVFEWLINYLIPSDLENAEKYCEKFISLDDLNETAYLLIMKIYAKKKDRNSLEEIYNKMDNLFQKEFGIPPSKEIIAEYNSLLKEL